MIDLQSRFPKPHQILIPSFGSVADSRQEFPIQGEFEAVSIGPQSEIDSCYLLQNGKTLPQAIALTGTGNVQNRLFSDPDIVKVSVDSPYIGELRGPLRVASVHAMSSYNAIEGYFSTFPVSLELLLHRKAPFWLPGKRPPATYNQYDADITGTAAIATLINVPGMGRKKQIFSFETIGTFTSGTLTVTIVGRKINGIAVAGLLCSTTLTSFTMTASDTEQIYEYEGEFDFYSIRLTKASIVGTDLSFHASVWQRD